MGVFQTLLALVVLIFILSVIVQAVQEILKSLLNTKANTLATTIDQFMGANLTLAQVQGALQARGLDITALEHLNKADFRSLLDGIELAAPQIQGIVAAANATADQAKDRIAGVYEAARAKFQQSYTRNNKIWALVLSFAVVLILNASLVRIYEVLAVDQNLSQAITGTASTFASQSSGQSASTTSPPPPLADVYSKNRDAIAQDLQKYPILLRTLEYTQDLKQNPVGEILGLLLMGALVSLGAPFWNDILKGTMGINNALNTNGKRDS